MEEKTEVRPKSGLPWEKGSLGQQMSWEGQVLGVVSLGEVVVTASQASRPWDLGEGTVWGTRCTADPAACCLFRGAG